MTIRSRRGHVGEAPTPTQAGAYYDMQAQRREAQAAMKVPRSQSSWDAEQNRPGSWNSGVGQSYTTPGQGVPISNGRGRKVIGEEEGEP
jgi:hypothetical protein